MKHTHIIVNVATNERITNEKITTSNMRDICRAYLTNPAHFGERLHVIRDANDKNEGTVIFDVTNIRYSSGVVRMTLFSEYERQMKMRAQTMKKLEARIATNATSNEHEAIANDANDAKKSTKRAKRA